MIFSLIFFSRLFSRADYSFDSLQINFLFLIILIMITDPPKKRSSFLCSIICCLGKSRSSKNKTKDKEAGVHGGGSNASSGDTPDNINKSSKAPQKALLPEVRPNEADKKCIVIDLDETLVHSSFKVSSIYLPSCILVICKSGN